LQAAADLSGVKGQVLRLDPEDDGGWRADIEVLEDNELIKSLNLPTRGPVKDRNVFVLRLDRKLELTRFTRLPHREWLALQAQDS
jgi:hypothetical protein